MTGENWCGAVNTEQARALHRTVGPHRAWTEWGWCYPSSPCNWCREHLGETQVWLPPPDREEALVARLVERTRHKPDGGWCYPSDVRAVLKALREEDQ